MPPTRQAFSMKRFQLKKLPEFPRTFLSRRKVKITLPVDIQYRRRRNSPNDDTHHNTDQPFPQPTQNGFESHGYDTDADNHASPLHRRSGNSKGGDSDTGQYGQKTENAYDKNSADNSRSNSASEETSRSYHNTNSYIEKDNRNINGHNIENHGTYNENRGDWKTVVVTGGLMHSAFLAAQLRGSYIQQCQLQFPTNAITIIYPQYSFDQLPSLALSPIVLPMVLINLLSLVRHSVSTVLIG
ncbi:hypothetical protein K435DRAFT_859155 [Dendrothele bispora CBS 962.96]|uniref:Uncharacterized protein n=1 Tax=Dendrothele bispora (strain CBS 962.96) TaxID=1314807 RepID=A0A4V6T5E9_DENBC|nr:hypothetical protein K435DRAFT_859155 [Dendrothele bispora CBS 962.96]